jgi:solute carrier family 25 folate transporter 32
MTCSSRAGGHVNVQVHAAAQRGVRTDELTASELVMTSAFSKMVASTITYPHEVIRSYMHVTGGGMSGGSFGWGQWGFAYS